MAMPGMATACLMMPSISSAGSTWMFDTFSWTSETFSVTVV